MNETTKQTQTKNIKHVVTKHQPTTKRDATLSCRLIKTLKKKEQRTRGSLRWHSIPRSSIVEPDPDSSFRQTKFFAQFLDTGRRNVTATGHTQDIEHYNKQVRHDARGGEPRPWAVNIRCGVVHFHEHSTLVGAKIVTQLRKQASDSGLILTWVRFVTAFTPFVLSGLAQNFCAVVVEPSAYTLHSFSSGSSQGQNGGSGRVRCPLKHISEQGHGVGRHTDTTQRHFY